MKVLFSPSETKTRITRHPKINENSFVFPPSYAKRLEVLTLYNNFIQKASLPMLQKLFGLKEEEKINELLKIIKTEMKLDSQMILCFNFQKKSLNR